jgi:hypothetical protein
MAGSQWATLSLGTFSTHKTQRSDLSRWSFAACSEIPGVIDKPEHRDP